MRTTNEQIDFYLNLVNENLTKKLKVINEYGFCYVKNQEGNDLIICGTKNQVYFFLVGLNRILTNK